jgi:hypothetical protein
MTCPDRDDVVIRPNHRNPSTVFLLGTPAAPHQFILRTRDRLSRRPLPMPDNSACVRGLRKGTRTSCCSARFATKKRNRRGLHSGRSDVAACGAAIAIGYRPLDRQCHARTNDWVHARRRSRPLVGIVTVSDLLELLGRGVDGPAKAARAPLRCRIPHRKRRGRAGSW